MREQRPFITLSSCQPSPLDRIVCCTSLSLPSPFPCHVSRSFRISGTNTPPSLFFEIGGAGWTIHVQGYCGAVNVPPDDHGSREDDGRGADAGVAARRWSALGDGGTITS